MSAGKNSDLRVIGTMIFQNASPSQVEVQDIGDDIWEVKYDGVAVRGGLVLDPEGSKKTFVVPSGDHKGRYSIGI